MIVIRKIKVSYCLNERGTIQRCHGSKVTLLDDTLKKYNRGTPVRLGLHRVSDYND